MNFQITEDEYNRLHAVQRQLNLMSRLLGGMNGWETQCDPEDLAEFFSGQESTLGEVRKAIDNRWELTKTVDKPMHWFDWMDVICIASGDRVSMHPERVQYIDDALSNLAKLDPSYGLVVKKWAEVSASHARKQRQNPE